jgi:hypothetical protein
MNEQLFCLERSYFLTSVEMQALLENEAQARLLCAERR